MYSKDKIYHLTFRKNCKVTEVGVHKSHHKQNGPHVLCAVILVFYHLFKRYVEQLRNIIAKPATRPAKYYFLITG